MIVDMVLCGLNILAAWYLGVKATMQNVTNEELAQKRTATGKAMHLLCYDPWIALYILVLVGFIVWLSLGFSWRLSGALSDNCTSFSIDQVTTSVACGYAFLSLGFFAMLLSLCLGACDERSSVPTSYHAAPAKTGYTAPVATASAVPEATMKYGSTKSKQDEVIPTALAVAM